MYKLTDVEHKGILAAAYEILTYKQMLARGFQRLADQTQDASLRNILQEISLQESQDAESWTEQIKELQPNTHDPHANKGTSNFRIRMMMEVLGSRGFFEWTLIAEDESVEALSLQANNIQDHATCETWLRIASDERLHIERMKKEVLGMEAWELGSVGGVRDVIFGANDGLVSILALVAGVFGAVDQSYLVLIAGVAGAIAGTISMGAGAYVSAKSEQEVAQKEAQRKGLRKSQTPEEAQKELVSFYQSKGFDLASATSIAERVQNKLDTEAHYSIAEQTGLIFDEEWPPSKAGLLTGLSFFLASLIPIIPFTFLPVIPAAVTAVLASILTLFAVGASKAIFTRQSWLRSGLEVMVIGTLASIATYLIGLLIPI